MRRGILPAMTTPPTRRAVLTTTAFAAATALPLGAALAQQELDQFCQRYGIRGGYISTSASSGEGLETLLETLKAQIPWEEMTKR